MGRIPHNTGAAKDHEIVRQALEAVDSWNLIRRNYTELSGGEKQRVQLARVLSQIWEKAMINGREHHRILLLDEPSASLDLAHQQMLKSIVITMAQQDVSIVMVVHDLNIAFFCADQMILMSDGKLVTQGTPSELMQGSLLQDVFGCGP